MLPDRSILIGQKLVENAKIQKHCETSSFFSGRPKPMVRWLWSGHPIRETSEVSSGSTVTSTVILRDLQREDNGALLTCLAKNNNVSTPVKHSVALLMNCKFN